VEEQPSSLDEGEMGEHGFEEVIYGRKRRKQLQQIITGTSRDGKIKAEKKKKKHGHISEE